MAATTKVWVRRPNSSPTRIHIPSSTSTPIFSPSISALSGPRDTPRPVDVELTEDFLVDDLREAILRKYPQSLGKHHDAADLSIRIPARNAGIDNSETEGLSRLLLPDESVIKILTEEYPAGQKSSEAWTIITNGGRDNYTRWWLQTGGLTDHMAVRTGFSPSQIVPTTGGSFSSEMIPQEYFPYVPQTVVTPPGELPSRSRASGPSVTNQYPRSQGRPPLRPSRTTVQQEGLFPGRRYDNTNTSSLVVEPVSGAESEISRQQSRGSPDSNTLPNVRYPPSIRPSSSISGQNTPPGEYPNRTRQYTQGSKQQLPGISIPSQSFQMQLPSQSLPTIPQKVSSPLGGPQQQVRLSQGNPTRPSSSHVPSAIPSGSADKPPSATKGATSPKSPGSGNSPNSGGTTTSPATRHALTSQTAPVIASTNPLSPSTVAERVVDSPRPPRGLPPIKPKADKEAVPTKNSVLGNIPPINVLIVEDNIINAQILEAFFRKRKLKHATAVNGKQAVEKWRQGGWHLVLMDIQLPVMSGIEATKEIRRLERVNHIGVFSEETTDKPSPQDELGDLLFPSPVIIVALTASSRDADRNEALAAGCNDFLTKPVGAPWLERKAIEWGCMQALIWTSFERKKRRKEAVVDENAVVENVIFVDENANKEEKPPVLREDSGESIKTDEGSAAEGNQAG